MTEPDDKQLEEYLAGKSEVSRLYKETPMEAPSATLDEKIMLAAREELRPRFQRWMLPLSAAAVTLFAVSIMLRMQHEDISPLPQGKMVVTPEVPAAAATAPAMSTDEAIMAKERQAPAAESMPAAAGEMKRDMRKDESPALMDAAPKPQALPSAGAAPPAPVSQDEMQEQDRAQSYNAAPVESDEGDSERLEAAPAAPAAEPRRKAAADSAGAVGAVPAAQEPSPEMWIRRIRELRAEGKMDAAAADIKAFRARYPDYPLPEDLKWAD